MSTDFSDRQFPKLKLIEKKKGRNNSSTFVTSSVQIFVRRSERKESVKTATTVSSLSSCLTIRTEKGPREKIQKKFVSFAEDEKFVEVIDYIPEKRIRERRKKEASCQCIAF